MNKKNKKEYLEKLRADKFFNHALSLASSEDEKKKIKAFAEDVFINLLNGVFTANKIITEHPEKMADVAEGRIPKDKQPTIIKDK